MSTWLLAAALLAAPSDGWSPAEAPPPTPWARANARGWRLCQEAERQARAFRRDEGPRGSRSGAQEQLWRRRAEQCPHAVEVLTAAAQDEIVEAAALFGRIESWDAVSDEMVATVVEEHRQRVEQALAWTEAAIEESHRREDRPPHEVLYYRAYALAALGRVPLARAALREAVRAGDVERWRSDRMSALVELYAGETMRALRLAHRGVVDAPSGDRTISRYIRALVLDRAGAPDVARAELIALRREAGSAFARAAMESVMPVHERLFFRALVHQANDEPSPSMRLWKAYLARPEPEPPERVLAERHLEELQPPPPAPVSRS